MPERIVVWVTTPELPESRHGEWMRLPAKLDSKHVEVRHWGSNDDGGGHGVLLVEADDHEAARTLARQRLRRAFGDELAAEADVRTVPRADDDAVFADDDDLDEGPLRCVREPLGWSEYADGDELTLLRVHFTHSGSAHDAALAEVIVTESGPTVSISLFQRQIWGTYPDGATAATPAVAVFGCVQVRLARPLGQRRVIDGTTGLLAQRVAENSDHRWIERHGCPIWEP